MRPNQNRKEPCIRNCRQIRAEPVIKEPGVAVRWLVSERDEAPNFAMRLYELAPGAETGARIHYEGVGQRKIEDVALVHESYVRLGPLLAEDAQAAPLAASQNQRQYARL